MAGFESQAHRLNIGVQFTRPIALDVKFEIRGFTALLGRSGAGKTSLLKALAGLIPATGTPWPNLPAQARPIGYLPQGAALFPHLTALENAAFALRGPGRFAEAQILLDQLGIGQLAGRMAPSLSGGEAQRVALARALARQPGLLLLDEPAAALDGATRDAILSWLIKTVAARAIPALAATHDPAIAGLADWLVLLAGGGIIRQGTPREVFNDPQTSEAAALLGFQNIWREAGALYAIRAEDIEIAAAGRPATVTSCRPQASGLRIECAAPHPLVMITRDYEFCFDTGQKIHLKMPKDKVKKLER